MPERGENGGRAMAGRDVPANKRDGCPGSIQDLVRTLPLSVFVVDWKLRIIYMNPKFERLTGFRRGDRGRALLEVHPDDREEFESSVVMALVGRTTRCRCRLFGPDGALHALELNFSPLSTGDGCRVLCVESGPVNAAGRRDET